jgi:hypothetical protein
VRLAQTSHAHSTLIVRAYDARHPGGAVLIETIALPFIDDVSSKE